VYVSNHSEPLIRAIRPRGEARRGTSVYICVCVNKSVYAHIIHAYTHMNHTHTHTHSSSMSMSVCMGLFKRRRVAMRVCMCLCSWREVGVLNACLCRYVCVWGGVCDCVCTEPADMRNCSKLASIHTHTYSPTHTAFAPLRRARLTRCIQVPATARAACWEHF
jgi:hypothetical protein